MITPRWSTTLCQPIGIRNVIEYLTEVVHHPEFLDQEFDIGGLDQLTYIQMLLKYADKRKLKRSILSAPLFTPSYLLTG